MEVIEQSSCTIDKSESIPSNAEARMGTPITGKGVSAATIPGKIKPELMIFQ